MFLHPQRQFAEQCEAYVRTPVSVPSPAQVTSLAFFFDDGSSRQRQSAVAAGGAASYPPLPAADAGAIPGRAAWPAAELGLRTEFARLHPAAP